MDWGGVDARDDFASRENSTGGRGARKYGIGWSADVVANLTPVRSLRHTFWLLFSQLILGLKETRSLSSLYERWYDPPRVCLNENIGKNTNRTIYYQSNVFLVIYFWFTMSLHEHM